MLSLTALVIAIAAAVGYWWNRQAARALIAAGARPHSIPRYHGLFAFLLIAVPSAVVLLVWIALEGPILDSMILARVPADVAAALDEDGRRLLLTELHSLAAGRVFAEPEPWKAELAAELVRLRGLADRALLGLVALLVAALMLLARLRVRPGFRARTRAEQIVSGLMIACALVAILTTVGIVASLLFEALRFFDRVPLTEFLFGLRWEPQIAMRADQVAAGGAFGWVPVLVGTLLISTIAMAVAVPVGLLSAIYLHEFASRRFRAVAKPVLEILAGVPTVVYGFFAVLVVAPALRSAGAAIGIPVAPNTALAAGSVMGIMLIPFISSFADDALAAVPRALRDGSLALGATRGETMLKVLFPAAIPGIVGGVLLAVSRAIGETMIVVMAAGIIAKLTFNPLDSVTTVTVQIVTLLIGDTEFDNPKTLAAFALGLMLFVMTLLINVIALRVVRKYRELYD